MFRKWRTKLNSNIKSIHNIWTGKSQKLSRSNFILVLNKTIFSFYLQVPLWLKIYFISYNKSQHIKMPPSPAPSQNLYICQGTQAFVFEQISRFVLQSSSSINTNKERPGSPSDDNFCSTTHEFLLFIPNKINTQRSDREQTKSKHN